MGMAHRGRLNVLAQVMGKPHRVIFHEFKGGSASPDNVEGSGDVKYHLGASSDREFDGNRVHLSLTANPSHLEIVDPVVLGKARAKQDQKADKPRGEIVPLDQRSRVLPLLLHGDAAFAGQGVVAECFGLSGLRGHRTAGSIHFIINNQIGFTTNPRFARSSPYPSDVAKTVEAPILHVNGDDPEAVVYAAKIATEFRQKFYKPVVIDMFCYRRHGHNEGDEPAFTQPLMYKAIANHPTTLEIYSKRLVEEGLVTAAEVDQAKAEWRAKLEAEFEAGQNYRANKADWLDGAWAGLKAAETGDAPRRGQTGVSLEALKEAGKALTEPPEGFALHKTVVRFLTNREKAIETGNGIDWATGEALAFAHAHQGRPRHSPVRTGCRARDVLAAPLRAVRSGNRGAVHSAQSPRQGRGALSRSSIPCCRKKPCSASSTAIRHPSRTRSRCGRRSSAISSTARRSSSTSSFRRASASGCACPGLTLLLPHGYEGQGPEHSSARLERFLQLCAEDNMQVANLTTPANYFHALRRQLKREFRKPLILMTPKSLLRHKRAVSTLAEMGPDTSFHRLLWDDAEALADQKIKLAPDDKIRRVVLSSGKVYYDLYEDREQRDINDVYLLRVEQLYPFPAKALINELARFPNAEVVWCQEEPKNMGAWTFAEPYLEWVLGQVGGQRTAAALRRPAGFGGNRQRPDGQASGAAARVPRRGVRGVDRYQRAFARQERKTRKFDGI